MLDGYYDDDGQWIAMFEDWTDIREAAGVDRILRVLDEGQTRMARWGKHPYTGKVGWLSVIDETVMLEPTHCRDLARPPE